MRAIFFILSSIYLYCAFPMLTSPFYWAIKDGDWMRIGDAHLWVGTIFFWLVSIGGFGIGWSIMGKAQDFISE